MEFKLNQSFFISTNGITQYLIQAFCRDHALFSSLKCCKNMRKIFNSAWNWFEENWNKIYEIIIEIKYHSGRSYVIFLRINSESESLWKNGFCTQFNQIESIFFPLNSALNFYEFIKHSKSAKKEQFQLNWFHNVIQTTFSNLQSIGLFFLFTGVFLRCRRCVQNQCILIANIIPCIFCIWLM